MPVGVEVAFHSRFMTKPEPKLLAPFGGMEAYYKPGYRDKDPNFVRLRRPPHFPDFQPRVYPDDPKAYHGFATLPPDHPHINHYSHVHLVVVDHMGALAASTRHTLVLWAGIMSIFTSHLAVTGVTFNGVHSSRTFASKERTAAHPVGWIGITATISQLDYKWFKKHAPPDFNHPFLISGRTFGYAALAVFGENERFALYALAIPRVISGS